MKKSLRKGRRDFSDRLIQYAIEANVLARCELHPGSIFRINPDPGPAQEAVRSAWGIGEISSGLDGALDQLNSLLDKAPERCSHIKCWSLSWN